jgi:hypothetical protein
MRPSDILEAQVHASIKSSAFAVSSSVSASATPGILSVPPLNSSSLLSTTPTPDVPIPEVFKNRRLRSGKWIKEEESYANVLIDQFENGFAQGCPNGVTLRSYLSRMLHCAPMRISKKYAGKGIGKMVFVSKVAPDGKCSVPVEDIQRRAALVKEKENKFYRAAFRNNEFPGAVSRAPVCAMLGYVTSDRDLTPVLFHPRSPRSVS